MKRALGVVAASALLLTGCAGSPGSDAEVTAVASIYPLAWLLTEVGGDRVAVDTLSKPGVDLHAVELSPRQVDRLGAADLALTISTLSPAVDAAVASSPPGTVLDAAELVELLPAVAHDHDHEDGDHEDGEDADDHDHEGEAFDPHVWTDPVRMAEIATAVADALAGIDPEGAQAYGTNAADVVARLTDLDAQYVAGLASCERRTLIVTHPAFGYLADRYDLEQVGVSGLDEESEPSPARLTEVAAVARAEGATTIFFTRAASPKVAQVLADDLGVEAAALSEISAVDEGEDYVSVATANLAALRGGLGCR